MPGVSTSIFASLFPSWPMLSLLLLLALLFSFQQGGAAWKSIIPRQREAPRTHCWGTSRGWAVQTEPSLLLLPGLVAGEGWSQPGMVPVLEPGSGGSSETGTRSGRMECPCPGQRRLPRLGRDSLGESAGALPAPSPAEELGGGFGDARRGCDGAGWDFPGEHSKGEQCQGPRGSLCRESCAQGWKQSLNESCSSLIGSVCSQLSAAPESQPAPLCSPLFLNPSVSAGLSALVHPFPH